MPYSTRYIGVEREGAQPYVVTPGKTGEKVVTYRLTLHDGQETAREKVGEEVTVQPVDEVVCRGAGGELVIDGETYGSAAIRAKGTTPSPLFPPTAIIGTASKWNLTTTTAPRPIMAWIS